MAGGGGGEELKLEFTPTWVVALVCSIIVFISLVVERLLHFLGKYLKKKNQKPLCEALQKVKEELMLLGFISLLLTVFQGAIQNICIPKNLTEHMLPCKKGEGESVNSSSHYQTAFFSGILGGGRRLLSGGGGDNKCAKFCKDLSKRHFHVVLPSIFVQHSFGKQFYGSVTKSDYTTMRLGFIMTHCRGNLKFNFHKYMIRALEADFKKVVGISWYLWVFVVIFLLLNVTMCSFFLLFYHFEGWHTYFWIAFIPLILLLAVGTKLEHVITQLAHEVAEKHSAIEGELVVTPSDDHFWFHRPRIVLYLIHFILFQNAFEIAFFFWILTTYGFDSCIMGQVRYIVPRLVIGVIIQILCSYSTLPLYAIVTQMGSSFKKAIFEDHVQQSIVDWAHKGKKRKGLSVHGKNPTSHAGSKEGSAQGIQMRDIVRNRESLMEEGNAGPGNAKGAK
ncbi:hypothetical protein Taro_025632 [Colocasia esculenta]|uniref:MLO-like protein n=1 Tax=Colocasia esculenta TaxID=4460 RepID=A0A843V3W0_COLES|nr:hypothetical protein [Colocasia esculenta]